MEPSGVIWEPVPGIAGPCGALSFRYDGPDNTSVTMHFAGVRQGSATDLVLRFKGLVSWRWELECPGFNPVPKPLPKCPGPEYKLWTFPLLKVENSAWIAQYAMIYPRRTHFL